MYAPLKLAPQKTFGAKSVGKSRAALSRSELPHRPRPLAALPQSPSPAHSDRRLEVSSPSDPLELEAERVAERVMQGADNAGAALSRASLASETIHRACAACAEEEEEESEAPPQAVARRAVQPGPSAPDTRGLSSRLAAARGRGEALPASVRSPMERRFGHGFGQVRVHRDAEADGLARRLRAHAFTVGSDIFFRAGAFEPASHSGQRLIAHELAHVLQHRAGAGEQKISRFAPPAPAVEAELETEALELPGGVRYAAPYNNSLEALMWRSYVRGQRERSIYEAERPILVVARGGAAPSFVARTGQGHSSAIGEHEGEAYGYDYVYDIHTFYAVSALEYDVAQARTAGQLAAIYESWFGSLVGMGGRLLGVTIPSHIDLRLQLMPYFMRAVRKKVAADPALANAPLVRALSLTFVGTEEVRSGPCQARDLKGRLGGNKEHNDFATVVTGGNPNDFRITSPEGWDCTTDGRDLRKPNVVWEVKVGHDWASDTGLARGSITRGPLHERMVQLEQQRIRCSLAAARCGYQYRYAVDTPEVAEALNGMWGGDPHVSCFKRDGTACPS